MVRFAREIENDYVSKKSSVTSTDAKKAPKTSGKGDLGVASKCDAV